MPLNLSMATIPVGEVTLISVSHVPPITSMPTNSSPRRLSSGPSAAQISRSVSVSSVASAVPPAARFERISPCAGRRLIAPGDLAVDEHDALVALGDLGKEGLEHVRLAIGRVEQLHQRGEVGAVAADLEHRLAGIAVERLDARSRHARRGTCARRRASG